MRTTTTTKIRIEDYDNDEDYDKDETRTTTHGGSDQVVLVNRAAQYSGTASVGCTQSRSDACSVMMTGRPSKRTRRPGQMKVFHR